MRLRRRIFKATREQDRATVVRSLQKTMLRSWSNTLVSVRQVTQRNTGRRTAGIDGEVALSGAAHRAPQAPAGLAATVKTRLGASRSLACSILANCCPILPSRPKEANDATMSAASRDMLATPYGQPSWCGESRRAGRTWPTL
ncbi:reverse transcriptase N-terminal domain-containing protein [Streptosporangium sp. NPDC006013]|uniref:reverse transcriptase N-terminal domain-containing protein n=1 Tax=Streptosporangium sp. NPDC006013 TaxID=3155596 RepID=UPI0033BEAB75